jgi:hypothetical protein
MKEKKNLLLDKVNNMPNKDHLLNDYNKLANIITEIYHYDVKLSKISSNYEIGRLPDNIKSNIDFLIHEENFLYLLVSKLLNKEPMAYSMYKEFYKNDSSMILEESDVLTDDTLYAQYIDQGGDFSTLIGMNANHWLQHTDSL